MIIFENDNLEQACKRLNLTASKSKTAYDRKEITFDDLNSLIAHKLASVLQPCSSYMKPSNYLGMLRNLIKKSYGRESIFNFESDLEFDSTHFGI